MNSARPIQEGRARFRKVAGPIPDPVLRRHVMTRSGTAQHASEMNARAQRPILLLSRLLRERALIRDTKDQYARDMQSAKVWEQQFLEIGDTLRARRTEVETDGL